MSLSFQPIEPQHRTIITKFTFASELQNCDLAFSNLCSWQFLYKTQFAVFDERLFIRFHSPTTGSPTYMMPLGEGDLRSALRWMHEDACSLGHDLKILGVNKDTAQQLFSAVPELDLKCEYQRNSYDYIYLKESLSSLKGKKLQSKRNLINRFQRLYGEYSYRTITDQDIPQCLDLLLVWTEKQSPEELESVRYEQQMIRFALRNKDDLGLVGGGIFLGDELIAFAFGSPINAETFGIHIEKANIDYEGAFAVINREFSSHIPEQFTHINREEDLGIAGLRQAKLSYQPERILEKCILSKRLTRKEQVRNLWQHCFNDSEEFANMFFSLRYDDTNTFTIDSEFGIIVSALQLFPYQLILGGKIYNAQYIMGVSTYPDHRGKGHARELLRQAEERAKKDGADFIMLIPATESLREYYKQFGYVPSFRYTSATFALSEQIRSAEYNIEPQPLVLTDDLYEALSSLSARNDDRVLHSSEDYTAAMIDIDLAMGKLLVAKDRQGCLCGVIIYLVADAKAKEIIVKEFLAENLEIEQSLLHEAMKLENCDRALWRTRGDKETYALVIPLSDKANCADTNRCTMTLMID